MQLNVFTILLNGMPWITEHYAVLLEQKLEWKWTIVHGIADAVKDTKWCAGIESVESDGSLEYVERLAKKDPRVTVIKQDRWPGKTAMCNAALETFTEDGLLLQLDADEVWTAAQINLFPALFETYPTADCALFLARVWVGPNRFVCTPDGWANKSYEWLRLWKYTAGKRFLTHEPPALEGQNIAVLKTHSAMLGLVFDHYSYVHREQIAFKEKFYGPAWSVEAWERLQTMRGPVNLKEVLPFVETDTISHEA
jgi:hypothetical protein